MTSLVPNEACASLYPERSLFLPHLVPHYCPHPQTWTAWTSPFLLTPYPPAKYVILLPHLHILPVPQGWHTHVTSPSWVSWVCSPSHTLYSLLWTPKYLNLSHVHLCALNTHSGPRAEPGSSLISSHPVLQRPPWDQTPLGPFYRWENWALEKSHYLPESDSSFHSTDLPPKMPFWHIHSSHANCIWVLSCLVALIGSLKLPGSYTLTVKSCKQSRNIWIKYEPPAPSMTLSRKSCCEQSGVSFWPLMHLHTDVI